MQYSETFYFLNRAIPTRMAVTKIIIIIITIIVTTTTNVDGDVEKLELSHIAGGN